MREERRRKRKLWIVSTFLTIALNFANQRPFFQQYSHSMHNDGQINDLVSLPCRFGGEFYRFYPFDINSPCIILLIVMIVIIMCNQLRGLCPWARSVRPRRFPRICKTTGFNSGDDGDNHGDDGGGGGIGDGNEHGSFLHLPFFAQDRDRSGHSKGFRLHQVSEIQKW